MANNKKLLITGATGFIGSHLTESCVKIGFHVKAFDRYNPNSSWGWLEKSKYKDDFEVVLGDIRDYDSVKFAMNGCDQVIHLAALIGIPYSYISPLGYLRTNIIGTYNVLESAKNMDIENITITSTSEVYGSAKYVPIDEKHPIVGQSPYSASKIGADQLAISYHRAFNLPVKIARPFNTYGPRQSARAIIPTIILQLLNGNHEIKLGNLEPKRDLTYVSDTCTGLLEISQSDRLIGETTNIGTNEYISIGKLVKKISEIMDKDVEVFGETKRIRPVKSEVDTLLCDNSKILRHTKWKPQFDLETGLKKTINWITKNKQLFKEESYSV